ncbi:hypothetical protein G4Y79_08190 [Phototrophicus methaneseepsis]|uniref:Uncharacterized protein n=1 Tax=Phototrophicus methaneseepsis TaxID=2710758 RepID=A0A7S8ECD3_9CHLR|nr:hypothetical protein [Phototrophicus methaneseepsis]QPC84341.1 hypothetical protein G4Y79_08190 [Phototrophicus methaneseepsis]
MSDEHHPKPNASADTSQQTEQTVTTASAKGEAERQTIKASRVLIRRVMDHLHQRHLDAGATETEIGFVNIVAHPTSSLPILNYVTPRRNTAWVSGKHIADGLVHLSQQSRPGVFYFPDLLFPPMFHKTLEGLGLENAQQTSIVAYDANNKTFIPPVPPTSITIQPTNAQQSMRIWWYIWRNHAYAVNTSSVDPLHLDYGMHQAKEGKQINLIVRRYNTPIGAARITLKDKTAHIATTALLREFHTPMMSNLLLANCLHYALLADNDVVFVSGLDDAQKEHTLALGFVDAGHIVCYAEAATIVTNAEGQHGSLAQPVFITQQRG